MFKNVAAKFMVFAFDSATGLPKTGDGANITAYVSKDYGTVTVLADTSATEMDSTNAKGYYLFDAAQGETNADCLMVSGKSTTSGIVVVGAPAVIYTRPTTGWLAPTTAGRTLDVSAGGEAGVDWANVGSPTTTVALTGTTIATTQKVDIETIKTQAVVAGATVTFPAVISSTTNITGGAITTVATVTGNVLGSVGSIATLTGFPTSFGSMVISSRGSMTISRWDDGATFSALVAPGGTPNVNSTFIGGQTASAAATVTFPASIVGLANLPTSFSALVISSAGRVDISKLAGQTVTAAAGVTFPAVLASTTNILDLADGVETGVTPRQALRLILSALAAKLSGGGTTTISIRDVGDTKDRIVATVDSNNNRTAVTLDAT